MIYASARELIKLSVQVFFRRAEVIDIENIPRSGAVIFFGNHPNSLLDPGLITAFGERKIHFVAKDTFFSQPLIGDLFRALGAVPIKRRSDHPDGPLDNQNTFSALYEVLEAGGAMGIFPEGLSHDGAQLAELKTGAARIALEMERRGVEVALVPCGLNYLRRDRFRSSVLIQFGAPLTVAQAREERGEAGQTDELDARSLTDLMEAQLRALTINAERWEDLTLLDAVRRIYQPPKITLEERAELARRFNAGYPQIRELPEVIALAERVQSYRRDLRTLGVRDRDISGELNTSSLVKRIVRHAVIALAWLPLATFGSPIHIPLALILGWSSPHIAPRKDVIATTKFLAGFLVLCGLYVSGGVALWWWGDVSPLIALLFTLLLALSGLGTLKLVERGHALWRIMWVCARLLTAHTTLIELRARRRALHRDIRAMVTAHLPADLERLFYQESPHSSSAHSPESS